MELYTFKYNGTSYNYASGLEDVELGGTKYNQLAISRLEISKELATTDVVIEVPYDFHLAKEFKYLNPVNLIEVTIKDDIGNNLFIGRIDSCIFNVDTATAKIKVSSLKTLLKSKIPSRTYSTICSKELFSDKCKASSSVYSEIIPYAELIVTDNTIQHTTFGTRGSGYFTGGWVNSGNEKVFIMGHVDNVITLMYNLQKVPSEDIIFYPGCDKLLDTCKTKFNNGVNFGGFPFIPTNNPVSEGY